MARRTRATTPPSDVPERIVDIDVSAEMQGSFLEYAYSVIYSRALPDARDGLKPVHRRILYGMSEMGLRPDRGHVKSARVVGDVMGKLHPHGDGAIYDTLVRMAQPFSMRVPLVDGHGNFGSLDDGPAAMRYCLTGDTRVRLADGGSVRIADLVDLPTAGERDIDVSVLDRSGRPVTATKAFHSGVHPIKRVELTSGHTIAGSHNHPLLCLVAVAGVPMFQWLRLDEITLGTIVCLGRVDSPVAVPTAREYNLGVLAGAWVSEGWAAPTRGGFNNTDKAYFDEVVHAFDEVVGGRRYISCRGATESRKPCFEVDVQDMSAFLASPLSELVGFRSADKFIPTAIWEAGCGVKRAFLMAAFESDGGINYGPNDGLQLVYCSDSRRLIDEMQELLLEFGVHATRFHHAARGSYKLLISSRHNVRRFADLVGFLTRKQSELRSFLSGVPKETHRLGSDHAPYVSEYVRSSLATGRRGSGASWARMNNFDRMDRWANHRSLILNRIRNAEVRSVITPIMDSGYRFVAVSAITDEAPAPVYSLRVESEDHAFLAGGFVNHNTEARLADPAMLMTTGLHEDVVDFRPSYDGQGREPEVLPSALPNLLVNGASGIAVGMATNMAPHNLVEVIQAARHLIKNPAATLDDLMRFVPGPDLPTGGKIVGLEGIREAYETGRGAFKTRASTRIESTTPRRKGIVVTELPYGVGPEKVIEKIADAVKAKKLQGISDVKDLTDRDQGLRLVIEIKNGFNPEAILEQLWRLTPMEDSFGINNVALVEGQPRTLGLRELLEVYVAHRLEVVRRRSAFRKAKAEERLHLVLGLLIAILDIDEVIQLIRDSDNAERARERLMSVFDLSDLQANYILDMPLRRLTKFSRLELEGERDELRSRIAGLAEILDDEARLRQVTSDELADVAKAHGTPRRTVLLEAAGQPATSAVPLEVADDPCWVLLSSTGLLARTTGADPLPVEGGRTKHDLVVSAVRATARGEIGAVTSAGRAVRLNVLDLPALPVTATAPNLAGGAPVSEFLELSRDEAVLGLLTLEADSPGLALGTQTGVVKRVAADYPPTQDSFPLIALKDGDRVVGAVELASGEEDLVFITSDAQLLRFAAASVRPQGRAAGGMAGIRPDRARVVFFGAVDPERPGSVVTISGSSSALPGTEAGSGKVTSYDEYPAKGRGTGGVRCHRFLKGEDGLILAWAGANPPRAAAATGVPVELPAGGGRRDGSGVALSQPVAAVHGPAGTL